MGEPQTSISTSSGLSIYIQIYTNVLSVTRCVQCISGINSRLKLCLIMKEIMIELQILTAVVSDEMGNGTLQSLTD